VGSAASADLAGASAPGAEALHLPSLGGGHVVGAAAHLPHQPLLLDLAAELAQRLLELLRVLDDDLQTEITSLSLDFALPGADAKDT